ncbi:MAG: Gfo/Idh/MocA family oxidoreductase, partial [Opitutales bacterium]|nr:Gfo/Idh/MocA family oxidoreductase [Opitutales bacterium]
MLSRRNFIKTSAFAAGTFAIVPSWAKSANGDIRVAVIGLNGRGKSLIKDVLRTDGARLVALCDVDSEVLGQRADQVDKENGLKVERYEDYRKLLENKDIDAVVLTTPNYWHALQTIWGCQAGKDVYVEKPVCHTVWEGRQMVKAAKKYGRIVQAGFQNRSDIGLNEAFPWVQAGNIGEIKMVRGLCYRNRASIGKIDKPLVPPKSVNYDLWLGPAEHQDLYRPELHYDWHWDFNTGNGDMGNQGPHELDLLRWVLGDPDHPMKVSSIGGRFGWND